jgi:hypothetical protein
MLPVAIHTTTTAIERDIHDRLVVRQHHEITTTRGFSHMACAELYRS